MSCSSNVSYWARKKYRLGKTGGAMRLHEVKAGRRFKWRGEEYVRSSTLWEDMREDWYDKYYCLNMRTYEMEKIEINVEVEVVEEISRMRFMEE